MQNPGKETLAAMIADKAVEAILKAAVLPISFRKLERLVHIHNSSVTPLEVRQAVWRLFGTHKYDLTEDMKIGPYDPKRYR